MYVSLCVRVCVAVLSERSAEDCPLYGAHGQTGLALLQRGTPLLKFTLSVFKVARNSMLSLSLSLSLFNPPCAPFTPHMFYVFGWPNRLFVIHLGSLTHSLTPLDFLQAYGCVHNHHLHRVLHPKVLHEEGWVGRVSVICSQLPQHGVSYITNPLYITVP